MYPPSLHDKVWLTLINGSPQTQVAGTSCKWLIVRQSHGVPNFLLIKISNTDLLGYGVEPGKVSTQSQMKSSPKSSPFLILFFLLLKQKLSFFLLSWIGTSLDIWWKNAFLELRRHSFLC